MVYDLNRDTFPTSMLSFKKKKSVWLFSVAAKLGLLKQVTPEE